MAVSNLVAAGGGVTQKVQEFTSTGTFVTPSNCYAVELFLVGGGGGGGGVGGTSIISGGGGGGGVITRTVSVTPGTSYTVTIGAGGAGGSASGASGTNGSDTTFGSLATAYGGGYGGGASTSTITNGGTRGTQGGAGGASFAASGGGAAAQWNGDSGNTVAFNTDYIRADQSSPKFLYSGGFNSMSSQAPGGFGIEGFGGGGHRGPSGNTDRISFISIHGGGIGGYNQAGGNGVANKGGGGGGVYKDPTAAAGGSGGSGYVRVTYWS